nr:hypothetical protein [Tanacetum cinerariifolium]
MTCEHGVVNRHVSCQQLLPSRIPAKFQRISLTWFHIYASRSQTGASQSRQSTESGSSSPEEKKRRALPRTPSGSPPSQPPPPPPPADASGTLAKGSRAPSSSKTTASTPQSMTWTTSDTRYESTDVSAAQESSPTDSMINDDSIPDEQVQLSDDEDTGNDQLPKADTRKDYVENNWATALSSTNATPAENSLLAKTGDITTFMNWYCRKVNKIVLTQADFEGHAYEVVKAFYPDVVYLQFQMEECHKLLTDQIDWVNPGGDQVKIDVSRPLPFGGPPGHVTIQT